MSIMALGRTLACGAIAVLLVAAPASAVTVFSNYLGGAMPGGSAFGTNQALAVQFTPAASAYLTDVNMYVFSGGQGFASALDVYLMTDSANKPGSVIESLGTLPTQTSSSPNLVQVLSSANPLLAAGTPYWIAATPHPGGQVAAGWAGGGSPSVLSAFSNSGGLAGPWSTQQNGFQFIVNGSANQPVCLLDLDGNLALEPLTDGLMIMRAMFGLTGTAVTNSAVAANASRKTWAEIQPFLFLSKLDIDGNGKAEPLTDGLVILRALFGLTGTAATNGATAAGAPRTSWPDIRAYLNSNCGTNFNP